MEGLDIRTIIEEANSGFPDLHHSEYESKIVVQDGILEWTKKGRKQIPFSKWWPDSRKYEESIFVRNFIIPLHSLEKAPMDCTSVEFFYRSDSPAIMVGWFQLFNSDRKKGLGNRLFNLMNECAFNLGAENVYISNVTNPSFWKHMGYEFFTEKSCKNYWRKSGE